MAGKILTAKKKKVKKNKWVKVVFADQCIYQDWDEDHECAQCPVCFGAYSECDCPGPTQDEEFRYKEINGVMYAQKKLK